MIDLVPFGYIDDIKTHIETREEVMELLPYNFRMSFSNNFNDKRDKYVAIRISLEQNNIEIIPDWTGICLSKPKVLMEFKRLRNLFWDYDTIFGTRYNIFKKYDSQFFNCEERVLFESLIINFKRNGYKEFKWQKSKIGYELGIKRKRLDSIIIKFKHLGIIKTAFNKAKSDPKSQRNVNSFYFNLNCEKIVELLPQIYSQFDYKKVETTLIKYLSPGLKDKK